MSLFLRVQLGAETKDAAVLQPGKLLTIGRIAENDVVVEDDHLMSSRHVTLLQNGDVCELKDLQSTNGTFIDDELVSEAELQHGDKFRCGQTEFQIDWQTQPKPAEADSPKVADAPPEVTGTVVQISEETAVGPADEDLCNAEVDLTEGYHSDVAVEVVEKFAIAEKLPIPAEEAESTGQFARRLLNFEDGLEAIRFISCALPRKLSIAWGLVCLRTVGRKGAHDEELIQFVQAWLDDPSDANRRAGYQVVQQNELESAAAMLATAVFYAHGSSTPVEAPYVASPYDLYATLVFVAVIIASADGTPEEVLTTRREFVVNAEQIANGKLAEVVA